VIRNFTEILLCKVEHEYVVSYSLQNLETFVHGTLKCGCCRRATVAIAAVDSLELFAQNQSFAAELLQPESRGIVAPWGRIGANKLIAAVLVELVRHTIVFLHFEHRSGKCHCDSMACSHTVTSADPTPALRTSRRTDKLYDVWLVARHQKHRDAP